MKLKASLMVLAMAISAFSALPAQAAPKRVFCAGYASKAVHQFQRNLFMGCGYAGPRWHAFWRAHKAWCMVTPRWRARQEVRIRRRALGWCRF